MSVRAKFQVTSIESFSWNPNSKKIKLSPQYDQNIPEDSKFMNHAKNQKTDVESPFGRGLRPATELAAGKPHGTRVKYMGGCKCDECRAANARYQAKRAVAKLRGEWNGIVPATRVREHLQRLALRGIGRRTVSDITGIGDTTLALIKNGTRKGIRKINEQKILDIDPDAMVNDGQLVPARQTWRRIRWLIDEGFTKTEIARRLGCKGRGLQLKKRRITARSAMKIEKLYNAMQA